MNNAILIQCATPYPGTDMMELTKAHHEVYCQRHAIDFQYFIGNVLDRPITLGGWDRIELMRRAMEKGYEYVAWIDPDVLIFRPEIDIRKAFEPGKIGVCWHRIPQLHHWNTGVMYVHNTPKTYQFIVEWLASYPAPDDGWLEQGVFNRMARAGDLVVTLSDKWNATIDVSMVPDAVVLGFHGQGDTLRPNYRLDLMRSFLGQIAKRESAQASPADGERRT